jgi:phenylpropionate dioxygenase-like ring-hydroxylating dioxygenase large terminal subunit
MGNQKQDAPLSVGPKAPTLPKWLADDKRAAPPAYGRLTKFDLGTEDVPVANYLSRAAHEAEAARLWPKVWQMVCHVSEVPTPGDYITYEICGRSFIVLRLDEASFKVYPNACLHRGTQLVSGNGHVSGLTCRFHGWSWNLDGSMRKLTEDWDFPQVKKDEFCLPAMKTGVWGGFVFMNEDPDAESLESYIGELPAHFASAPLENRYVAAHAARTMPANWKVSMEAFMESYHVMPTHPQSVSVSEYAETQYDIYPPNVSRLATISIAPAAPSTKAMSQQELANYVAKMTGREPIEVPEGQTFRQALAEHRRNEIGAAHGKSVDHLTDVELLDAVEYFLFPNFLPWHGFGVPIVYRFRPNGDDHETSIMEVYLMAPRKLCEPVPKAAETFWLRADQSFSEMPALNRLGPIFDQDYDNIVNVQKGLRSTKRKGVVLGRYQESRIRHYHKRIAEYLND